MKRLRTCFGGEREEGQERGMAAVELFEIVLFAVRGARLPTAEEHADPFEGQASQSGVVAFADGALLEIEGFGPGGLFAGTGSELVESLEKELGAGPATLHSARFATAFGNWCDTR